MFEPSLRAGLFLFLFFPSLVQCPSSGPSKRCISSLYLCRELKTVQPVLPETKQAQCAHNRWKKYYCCNERTQQMNLVSMEELLLSVASSEQKQTEKFSSNSFFPLKKCSLGSLYTAPRDCPEGSERE